MPASREVPALKPNSRRNLAPSASQPFCRPSRALSGVRGRKAFGRQRAITPFAWAASRYGDLPEVLLALSALLLGWALARRQRGGTHHQSARV